MKRMILASLIGLIASGAYASDLSYGGPYSQMKLKLCSDTPPSRSILPDGSLVCDGEDNDPNAYCVGGFNYADTDIFNCGSASDDIDINDLNGNGQGDVHEDWDGDGIPNGQDPDPYTNNTSILDENKNGIPDDIEGVYEELARTQEILYCNNDDDQCHQMRYAMRDLTKSNQMLAQTLSNASLRNVRRNDFNQSVGALTETVNNNDRAILNALENFDSGGSGVSVGQLNAVKDFLNGRISETAGTNYTKINQNSSDLSRANNNINSNNRVIRENGSKLEAVNSNTEGLTRLNNDIQRTVNQLTNKVDNLGGGSGGLTTTQKNQLKNAAKANANQKILKQVQQSFDSQSDGLDMILNEVIETKGGVDLNTRMISTVADDVNENTDARFNQLSDQIGAISGGASTVDLSSVEDGINDLSEKIDGLENGNGTDLSALTGAINGVADGVSDIGDLLKGVDASKAGIDGTCIQGGTCQGFYESAYEGDLSTVVGSQLDSMKTSIVDPFVSSFGNIDLSGAQRPKFGLPVPFYGYM